MKCENCAHWGDEYQFCDEAQVLGVRRCTKAVELWEADFFCAHFTDKASPSP